MPSTQHQTKNNAPHPACCTSSANCTVSSTLYHHATYSLLCNIQPDVPSAFYLSENYIVSTSLYQILTPSRHYHSQHTEAHLIEYIITNTLHTTKNKTYCMICYILYHIQHTSTLSALYHTQHSLSNLYLTQHIVPFPVHHVTFKGTVWDDSFVNFWKNIL